MTVTKVPLSLTEKKKLRKVLRIRIILGICFVLPIMMSSVYAGYDSVTALANNTADFMSLVGIGLCILCLYLFFRFVIPFYKQSFKNVKATDKLVIETRIIDIKSDFDGQYGLSYVIHTEAPVPIRSMITSLFNPAFGYKDMRVNMRIRIHCMEDNLTDILYIEPSTG